MNNLATNTIGEVDDGMADAHGTVGSEQERDFDVDLPVVPSYLTFLHRFCLQDGFGFVQISFLSQETLM